MSVLAETTFSKLCTWVGVRLAFSALYLVFELGMVYFIIFQNSLGVFTKFYIFLFFVSGHVIIIFNSPADPLSLCAGFGSLRQRSPTKRETPFNVV